ncbi:MAG: M81 family metallopeptidase [Parvibaculaceae bacterium]
MSRCARVALVGFYHETNSFSRARTSLELFRAYQFAEGPEIIDRYRGTGTEIGGVIAGAEEAAFDLCPILFAAAVPFGPIADDCYDDIARRCRAGLGAAGRLDGVIAVLHGAASTESEADADGALLRMIREVVGPSVPVVATLDFHANVSAEMMEAADAMTGYRTYPHRDMADRGREAAALLKRLMAGERLYKAHVKLPLLTVPQCQATDDEPMLGLMAKRDGLATAPDVASLSVLMGFAYSDCAHLGASVVAYATSQEAADRSADELARSIWEGREAFVPVLEPLSAIAGLTGPTAAVPVVLLDPADNVGGGSAGDGTAILAELLAAKTKGAVVVLCDPAAAQRAAETGIGNLFSGPVGARTDDLHGAPVQLGGTVTYARDTQFRHSGSYMTGFVSQMGLTAIVDTGSTQVVLTSLRTMPFDIEQLRSVGIEPGEQRVLVVKSAIAWRAAYGSVARTVVTVDTPGICSSNVARFAYRKIPRPMFPLDRTATF